MAEDQECSADQDSCPWSKSSGMGDTSANMTKIPGENGMKEASSEGKNAHDLFWSLSEAHLFWSANQVLCQVLQVVFECICARSRMLILLVGIVGLCQRLCSQDPAGRGSNRRLQGQESDYSTKLCFKKL